jgi:hypothetical protein
LVVDWRKTAAGLEIVPKDGVRRRFYALLGESEKKKLRLILDTDRFAASQPIVLKDDFSAVRFTLESDNPAKHVAKLRLSGLAQVHTLCSKAIRQSLSCK